MMNRNQAKMWMAEVGYGIPDGYGVKNEPVTAFIAANSGIISAVGTAFSFVSDIMQSSQQASANRQAAEYNAAVANNNAIAARQQAEAEASRQQRLSAKAIGDMRAAYGASGVTREGTALDVLEESTINAELDRLNILYGGEVKASGYSSTAALERSRASSAGGVNWLGAGSSLLLGASRYGQSEYEKQQREIDRQQRQEEAAARRGNA